MLFTGQGKNKDKDKEKDPATNPDAEMVCHCHRKGHRNRDCRTFEKDKDKKGVNAAGQAPGLTPGAAAAPSATPLRVSMIELDDWILAVSLDDHEEMVGSIERVMVGSEAALGYALEVPMSNHSGRATLRTASGAQIEHAGHKMVECVNGDSGGCDKAVGGGR